MLNLYRGRELESDQASSIVHLVASSVPNLMPRDVTLIDQQGRLLSSGEQGWNDAATSNQFKVAERVERNYKRRIEDLLTPLVGPGRVRAEVVADLDFTVSEETRERFDPNGSAVISESISQNQQTGGGSAPQGVPGALSNQPPEAVGAVDGAAGPGAASAEPQNSSSSSTRNFEVDRTISHIKPQTGTIRRLSIAVLVDDTPIDGADESAQSSLTEAQIQRFTALIKEAVGFDEGRGDTVAVVNAAFQPVPEAAVGEEPKFWENPVIADSLRQILGVALALALAFGLVRPMLKTLLASTGESAAGMAAGADGAMVKIVGGGQAFPGNPAISSPSYDEKVAAAKNISAHDPAKVAQIVKQWVGTDAA